MSAPELRTATLEAERARLEEYAHSLEEERGRLGLATISTESCVPELHGRHRRPRRVRIAATILSAARAVAEGFAAALIRT